MPPEGRDVEHLSGKECRLEHASLRLRKAWVQLAVGVEELHQTARRACIELIERRRVHRWQALKRRDRDALGPFDHAYEILEWVEVKVHDVSPRSDPNA